MHKKQYKFVNIAAIAIAFAVTLAAGILVADAVGPFWTIVMFGGLYVVVEHVARKKNWPWYKSRKGEGDRDS